MWSWYKQLVRVLESEFNEQFVKIGSEPDLEYQSAYDDISFVINQAKYRDGDYLILKLIISNGKYGNVINRIRNVVKDSEMFKGIIFEGVMSHKMYNKVSHFEQIRPSGKYTIDDIQEHSKKYFESDYGDFLETF